MLHSDGKNKKKNKTKNALGDSRIDSSHCPQQRGQKADLSLSHSVLVKLSLLVVLSSKCWWQRQTGLFP